MRKASLKMAGTLAVASVVLAMPPSTASAQLRASAGIESFSWKEDTTPEVKESGALLAFGLEYTRIADAGLLWAYRGRLYFGSVDYEGATLFPPVQPVTATTEYTGTVQEAQLRYRFDVGGQRGVDLVAGAGVDLWQRRLSSSQKEDYVIGFARLGLETERAGTGWLAGLGVKMPFYSWEDSHLTDIGFQQNPRLKPGKEVSGYLHAGYHFQGPLALVFYVDSLRLSRSPAEPVVHNTQGSMLIFQPASTRYSAGFKVVVDF